MSPPKLYFVVTTSIQTNEGEKNALKRQEQYIRGISSLVEATQQQLPLEHQIVVVENNGHRRTFLDDLDDVTVLYTTNNKKKQFVRRRWWLPDSRIPSKGTKELWDILACIDHFDMQPHDLVVKMTGRYYLDNHDDTKPPGNFLQALHHLRWTETQAIVKFGSYMKPLNTTNVVDCITGLIMMPVHAIRRIQPRDIIEHAWAQEALALPPSTVIPVQGPMGIHIAPGGVEYYLV